MALPDFNTWLTDWKSKHPDFDEDKAQKFIYDLSVDKDTLTTQKATVTQERDAAVTRATTAEATLAAKAQEGESAEQRAQRLEQELAAEKAKPAPGAVTPEVQQLRLAAAMSVSDDITAKAAMTLAGFIQGTTKEEAEASAKTFVDTFGIPGAKPAVEKPKDDEDDVDDHNDFGDNPLHQQPRGTVHNPLDPKPNGGGEKPVGDLIGLIPRL